MSTIAPPAVVVGPVRTPLPYGLGSVLAWRDDGRWEQGITFQTDGCGPAKGRGIDCEVATDDQIGMPKVFDTSPGTAEGNPFAVYGESQCNPIGGGWDSVQAAAERSLLAREEARVEQAFWTGDLGNVPNLSGANGFPAPVSVGSAASPEAALALVEQGIAEKYGSLGIIHMSRYVATLVAKRLEVRGGRLYTELGTPVVAGSGYTDKASIIGTPAMVGYRSDIVTNGSQASNLDRAQNVLYGLAERVYVLGMDACPIVKATITTPVGTSEPPPGTPLAMALGSIPSSPIPDGTDTTIIVHTNVAPTAEVYLWYAVNGGTETLAGEMTEVGSHEFVWNVVGDSTTTGDTVEVWAVSEYDGSDVESNHITIEVS